MKVTVIGSGYVGTTTAVVLALLGHQVTAVDIDANKVDQLSHGILPFFEPGLDQLLPQVLSDGCLRFTTDAPAAVKCSTVVILTVPTPAAPDGTADLRYLQSAADTIALCLSAAEYKVIAVKSTVPVGTNAWLAAYLRQHVSDNARFDVVSNPEFLREGSAVDDSLHPDRTVIGGESTRAIQVLRDLYNPLQSTTVETDWYTAELIKYASNSFLAAKISFMNEMARIAEKTGADIVDVARGMGLDVRIGLANLRAGLGYGGSCFPKDVQALTATARATGVETRMLQAIEYINRTQYKLYLEKLRSKLSSSPAQWTVAVLGLAFKPDTDDQRESPAILVTEHLLEQGAKVRVVDPTVGDIQQTPWKSGHPGLQIADSLESALTGADAAILCTDWPVFLAFDWQLAKDRMRRAVIVDARNALDPDEMAALGIEYLALGRRRS